MGLRKSPISDDSLRYSPARKEICEIILLRMGKPDSRFRIDRHPRKRHQRPQSRVEEKWDHKNFPNQTRENKRIFEKTETQQVLRTYHVYHKSLEWKTGSQIQRGIGTEITVDVQGDSRTISTALSS